MANIKSKLSANQILRFTFINRLLYSSLLARLDIHSSQEGIYDSFPYSDMLFCYAMSIITLPEMVEKENHSINSLALFACFSDLRNGEIGKLNQHAGFEVALDLFPMDAGKI